MPSNRSRLARRVLIAVTVAAALAAALLLTDCSLRNRDLHLRLASSRNLRSLDSAFQQYWQQVHKQDWRAELVRLGVVDEEQLRDPRSGQPYIFFDYPDLPVETDLYEMPMACAPLSDSPFSWWFDLYGRDTRGGIIMFGDGHSHWCPEQEYREALSTATNRR